MLPNILDLVIVILFLYEGIRTLKSKTITDNANKYTEESKKKAYKPMGALYIIIAAVEAVAAILKFKGVLKQGAALSIIYIAIAVAILVGIIVVYGFILKKKN